MYKDRFVMKFDNVQGNWFADVPEWLEAGGAVEALEMVLGADELLYALSNNEEEVKLFLTTHRITKGIELKKDTEECEGWWYWVNLINEPQLEDMEIPERIWLCSVTAFVLNGFPDYIFVRKV